MIDLKNRAFDDGDVEIKLKNYEIFIAAMVGARRTISGFTRDKSGQQDPNWGWHSDIEGAAGEMAVAKALNIYYDGSVGTFKAPDVGEFQVRHSERPEGSLIVRENDSSSEIFILVTGKAPNYVVRGYILGLDAKKERFIRNPNGKTPAWFVPQNSLQPIRDLKK